MTDISDIRRGLELMCVGGTYELRIPRTPHGTLSGYYKLPDQAEDLVTAAATWSGKVGGVYLTLNPVIPDVASRALGRLRRYTKGDECTMDPEIERRTRLGIDFDPSRPAGISSSNQEAQDAYDTAFEAMQWLTEMGWPDGLIADSGNGAHLVYAIDLPNDEPSHDLVKDVLRQLSNRFSSKKVTVDRKVANASRIWKVYGTMACKGDPTEQRPHRASRVCMAPIDGLPVVPIELLERLAYGPSEKAKARSSRPLLAIVPRSTDNAALDERWARSALDKEISRLRGAQPGERNDQLLKSTASLAEIVAGGYLLESEVERELEGAAEAIGLDRSEIRSTMRSGFSRGSRNPRHPERKQLPFSMNGHAKQDEQTAEDATEEDEKAPRRPTQKYFDALAEAGYSFTLNDLTDTVAVNGAPMDDITRSRVMNDVRDRGLRNTSWTEDSINHLAGMNRHHPVRDYLRSLEWDGKDHIAALAWHLKSEDPEWVETALQHWLLGAVGKALERAQNYMLVLAGPQNIGKSYLARWINPMGANYHVEGPIRPDDKDDRIRLIKNLTWEVGELGATTRRADVEALKSFVALQQVTVRKPYGHGDMEKPALASLIGTINPSGSGFLTDTTGNRRFVIVELSTIDRGYSSLLDPAQLWAQAVALYTGPECAELSVEEQAIRDSLNEQHMLENAVQLYFDRCYTIEPDADLWIPSVDILQDMEISGLKINQNETLKRLAEHLKKEGVEKGRPRQKSGERGRMSYRGLRRKPGI